MQFGVLGTLAVSDGDTRAVVRGDKLRALLAALLLDANTAVSVDRLTEALWGESPPASATSSLQNHLMRLRRQLGDGAGTRISSAPPGYLIRVEPGELDLHAFEGLCASGRQAHRDGLWQRASDDLSAALALWRGAPLDDVPGAADRYRGLVQQLVEARTQALEARIGADLELGRHSEVIGELRVLTTEHPLREALHGQLMLGLFRCGRQAEALEAYRDLRSTLSEELGVEPSEPLRQLHQRILNADPGLLRHPPAARSEPAPQRTPGRRVPAQLPTDMRAFTGRSAELDELLAAADEARTGSEAGMVVISAIDGMGGVGKSVLAVRAAHRMRESFPDGQLFLDLLGHTPGTAPLGPDQALEWLLRSLGAPPQLIPAGLGERAAYYRDRLAGTRTLILLDNAASTAQIRPLLPSASGCLVLVTSRQRLTGLDDARTIALDVLPHGEAVALLHRTAGRGRIPDGHPAVDEAVELCGHIPLAVRIVAARLRHRRALGIEDVVRQLRGEHDRLSVLQDEDRSLTAVFESSYRALPPAEQELFRSLGHVPGPDFDAYAAASLVDTDLGTAERLLESLLDHNMLTQLTPGRYRFHDLVRLYARTVPDNGGDAVRERLLDYYQHTAEQADRHLARATRPGPPVLTRIPPAAPDLPDRARALSWMRAEHDNLVAAARVATGTEPGRLAGFSAVLGTYLLQEGPWPQAAELHQAAVETARQQGDRFGEAGALTRLSLVRMMTGDFPAASELQERSLTLYQGLGDRLGEAQTWCEQGRIQLWSGSLLPAAELLTRALTLFQAVGDPRGQANALFDLGRTRRALAQYPEAADLLERSLELCQKLGQPLGEANALCELGRIRQSTGNAPAAAGLLERALAIYQELDSRLGEANILWDLGRLRYTAGDLEAAGDLLERSLDVFQELRQSLGEANALIDLGRVRTATGDLPQASDLLARALETFRTLGQGIGEASTLTELGRVAQRTGDRRAAAELFTQAAALFAENGGREGEADVLVNRGSLAAESGDPGAALALYRQALELARSIRSPLAQARALEGIGSCTAEGESGADALGGLREAADLYRHAGATAREQDVRSRLAVLDAAQRNDPGQG
jgi:DNA-binding SARP family transcriptional activator/tetratricopeptide (TPR) repeat protein